jgi:hypothetical protein
VRYKNDFAIEHTHMMQLSNVEFVVNSSFDSPTFKTHDTIDGEIILPVGCVNIGMVVLLPSLAYL